MKMSDLKARVEGKKKEVKPNEPAEDNALLEVIDNSLLDSVSGGLGGWLRWNMAF